MSCRVFSCLLLFSVAIHAVAEQPGCTTLDLPVNVIKASGEPVPGLTAADFVAQVKKESLAIESARYENAPRRILFVIDTTRKLSPDARRLEVEFASGIIAAAQAEDSFALLTARGITQEVKFGADRSELMKALKTLGDSAAANGDAGKQTGPLDAVTQGISWFGEPRTGDSIVLMAVDLEDNRKANPKTVARLLSDHRIRLFGVALAHLLLTNETSASMTMDSHGFGYRQPGVPLHGEAGDPNFFPLSIDSGGYIAPENTKTTNVEFKLTEPRKQQVQKNGALMAGLIDKFYDLKVKAPAISHAEAATIGLDKDKLRAMPGTHVLFPHEVSPCSGAVANR